MIGNDKTTVRSVKQNTSNSASIGNSSLFSNLFGGFKTVSNDKSLLLCGELKRADFRRGEKNMLQLECVDQNQKYVMQESQKTVAGMSPIREGFSIVCAILYRCISSLLWNLSWLFFSSFFKIVAASFIIVLFLMFLDEEIMYQFDGEHFPARHGYNHFDVYLDKLNAMENEFPSQYNVVWNMLRNGGHGHLRKVFNADKQKLTPLSYLLAGYADSSETLTCFVSKLAAAFAQPL